MQQYVETLMKIPWTESSDSNFNFSEVQGILDKHHFGLEEVK